MDTFSLSNSRYSPKSGSAWVLRLVPPVGLNASFQEHHNKFKVKR